MQEAIAEARIALLENEVPIGAVIVRNGEIVSHTHNRCVRDKDPSAHAELLAMREAYFRLGSMEDCTLYVTLEPCAMCAGAMIHYNLPRLVYGAFDRERGCCGSRIDLTDHWFEYTVETVGGVCAETCSGLLNEFFRELRKE